MSPVNVAMGREPSCFPRVSGDEPAAVSIALAGAEFSPRERG